MALPQQASGTRHPVDVPAAGLLNGFIGTHVLYALIMTGVLAALEQEDRDVTLSRLAETTGSDRAALRSLLHSADRLGLVSLTDGAVRITERGREAYRVRGYFTATVGGFGDVLRHLDSITVGTDSFGATVHQDDHLTALGCSQNWTFQQPIFDAATEGLAFTRVADIGCGAATRLIHLVGSRPGVTGIGVDLSTDACQLARENVKRAGLDDRITIIQGNILDVVGNPQDHPQVTDADLVMSYFILHHFMDRQVRGRTFLNALRSAFGRAEHLVLADGFREPGPTNPDDDAPLFTLAYQLFHDYVGISLQTHEQQRAQFLAAGFTIDEEVPFGHPLEWLFVLRPDRG
jgi:SAM-dependent methyltransferase